MVWLEVLDELQGGIDGFLVMQGDAVPVTPLVSEVAVKKGYKCLQRTS